MIKLILCLVLELIVVNANPLESDIPAVEPSVLSALLKEKRYEEFAALLKIPDPSLVIPKPLEGRSEIVREEVMYNQDLFEGDIVPYSGNELEEGRQVIDFSRFGGNQWPELKIPYVLSADTDESNNNFTLEQRQKIEHAIAEWNAELHGCVQLVNRTDEPDYVFVFSGSGCWSYLGRVGGQQAMSLQHDGCIHNSVILHEFQHAAGFHHEHNRLDRDKYVNVLWDNIRSEWHSQYNKTDKRWFCDVQGYDYYSIMHYPVRAPGTGWPGKPAFEILDKHVDESRIGRGAGFTNEDKLKIREVYKCSR